MAVWDLHEEECADWQNLVLYFEGESEAIKWEERRNQRNAQKVQNVAQGGVPEFPNAPIGPLTRRMATYDFAVRALVHAWYTQKIALEAEEDKEWWFLEAKLANLKKEAIQNEERANFVRNFVPTNNGLLNLIVTGRRERILEKWETDLQFCANFGKPN